MSFQEVVEAEGHLIDSHIMENIFDKVVEHNGRFEVEQFRIGRTNSEPSYLRLKVETADPNSLSHLLEELLMLGCAQAESSDALLATVDRDCCAPEDFYSTTNHRTHIRHRQRWIEVENQRMDALIVVEQDRAYCRRESVGWPECHNLRGRPSRIGARLHQGADRATAQLVRILSRTECGRRMGAQ